MVKCDRFQVSGLEEHQPVLVPVSLLRDKNLLRQLDNHTTQLAVPVSLRNGTVTVAGQFVEPDEIVNINLYVPLQLHSPSGVVLSSTSVIAEGKALLMETQGPKYHVFRIQLLVTSIDSRDVTVPMIPEVRMFMSEDGYEKKRTVMLIKPDDALILSSQDPPSADALAFMPVEEETTTTQVSLPETTTTATIKQKPKKHNYPKVSYLCSGGCPNTLTCLRPDTIICGELPPAIRVAICAVLLCLAAFLLMLFIHVFVLRPTPTSLSSRNSSFYARNMRAVWLQGYAPIYDKEACA